MFIQSFQWKDEVDDTPIDLTDYALHGRFSVGSVTVDLTEGSGITVVDPLEGIFQVELTDEQTSLFEEHFGDYELWVETPAPDSDPLPPILEGPLYISP